MALPITIPFTFGNATTTQSLSSLDTNFTTITNSVNGLTNGASQINVASISATGTANATTFLRGDGSWTVVSGSGTVTSINANSTIGFTFTGGPVTSSGTLTLSGPTPGTSGNVLTSNGTVWLSSAGAYPLTLSTVNAGGANPFPSTAGPASVDFTSIPSWVKRIIVIWKGVSTSGTSLPVIQLGTGGTPTYTITGYVGASVNQVGTFTSFTNGFGIFNGITAANVMTGMFILTLQDLATNTWVCSHSIVNTAGSTASYGDGYVVLSAALTAVRNTTTNGTDLFDAGSINIQYE